MQLTGTNACKIRDTLLKARAEKKITLKQITDRLFEHGIPDWLQTEILQMVNHNKMKRITCPVELAMEAAVSSIILEEILKENGSN